MSSSVVPETAQPGTSTGPGDTCRSEVEDNFPLPAGWRASLAEQDHRWVSHALFKWSSKGKPQIDIKRLDGIWFHPPPNPRSLQPSQLPGAGPYFTHRLCLWMPKKMWKYAFRCPQEACRGCRLVSAGLYRTVRKVLDIDQFYYLAGEYLQCPTCTRKLISWSRPVLTQMELSYQSEFPAVLTYHLACDIKVVTMMRQRSAGNSPSQLLRWLEEQHTGRYMKQVLCCLEDRRRFLTASGVVPESPACPPLPSMDRLPGRHWLQAVCLQDTCERLQDNLAAITSVLGSVLKVDSTRKVVKKLQGRCAGTTSWATTVGNEHGQVLTSVLTTHKGTGLQDMFLGLQTRYHTAGVPPPQLLYVKSHCCSSNLRKMLQPHWSGVTVRLDVWCYMRRIASAVTTEFHALYHSFMRGLSKAIFTWDESDYRELIEARRAQLREEGILHPTDSAVLKKISRRDLALHCRRSTRGMEETKRLIGELLEVYTSEQARDTRGIPLLDKERAWQVWKKQQRHLPCLQDPPGVRLYTQTGTVNRGGVSLPTFRCARGLTSLGNFHRHLNHFIPGNSTSHVHYQAYLVEALMRWNQDRDAAAEKDGPADHPRCYDIKLLQSISEASARLVGRPLYPWFKAPRPYTGEKIGYDYLLAQNASCLIDQRDPAPGEDMDQVEEMEGQVPEEEEEEEDFEESREVVDETIFAVPDVCFGDPLGHALVEPSQPSASACDQYSPLPVGKETSAHQEPSSPGGAPGHHHVQALVQLLLPLRNKKAASDLEAQEIVQAYRRLNESDKRPLRLRQWIQTGMGGALKARGCTAMSGGMATGRRRLSSAMRVDGSRLVEGVVKKLCLLHRSPVTQGGRPWRRLALRDYLRVRSVLLDNPLVRANTCLHLPNIPLATLRDWSNRELKGQGKVEERCLPYHPVSRPAGQSVPRTAPRASTVDGDEAGDGHLLPVPERMAGLAPTKPPVCCDASDAGDRHTFPKSEKMPRLAPTKPPVFPDAGDRHTFPRSERTPRLAPTKLPVFPDASDAGDRHTFPRSERTPRLAPTKLPVFPDASDAGDQHTFPRSHRLPRLAPSTQLPSGSALVPVLIVLPPAVGSSTTGLQALPVLAGPPPALPAAAPSSQLHSAPTAIRRVPKSTLAYRKRQLKRKAAGEPVRINKRHVDIFTCRKCEKPRLLQVDGQLAHTQIKGAWWCRQEDVPLQEWTKRRVADLAAKKKARTSEPGLDSEKRPTSPPAAVTSSEAVTSPPSSNT